MSGGRLQYLTIVGYKDNALSTKIGAYRALINPDKYTQSIEVHYNEDQGLGTPNASLKYKKTTPPGLNFELLFDATGVLSTGRTDLIADINDFKKVACSFNGDIHSPNYLKLIWGKGLTFQCRLTSLSLNYTLFRSDGSPLRARASVSFKEYQSPQQIADNAQIESPDMTHERIIKAGDTLPALTYSIYGDSSHYLKVAAYNKLDNFRYLVPGTKVFFPPLV